jgi:hypothetical protein
MSDLETLRGFVEQMSRLSTPFDSAATAIFAVDDADLIENY